MSLSTSNVNGSCKNSGVRRLSRISCNLASDHGSPICGGRPLRDPAAHRAVGLAKLSIRVAGPHEKLSKSKKIQTEHWTWCRNNVKHKTELSKIIFSRHIVMKKNSVNQKRRTAATNRISLEMAAGNGTSLWKRWFSIAYQSMSKSIR